MRVLYGEDIGQEIPDDEVVFYDGILRVLENGNYIKWILVAEDTEPISLADISKRYPKVEKVSFDTLLHGWIYTYGNHKRNEWELTGETCGFA